MGKSTNTKSAADSSGGKPKKSASSKSAANASKAAPKRAKKHPTAKPTSTKKTTSSSKAAPKQSNKQPQTKSTKTRIAANTSKPESEKKQGFRRRTIAERTVAWKTGAYFKVLRWLILLPLFLLIIFFTFFMAGYSFTVLVCWCLIGIILFYNITHLLREKSPRGVRTVRNIFTVILCIGLLVVGITEAIIIEASFGDPQKTCDYVVVLGAKVRPDGPSVSLMDRIYAAADYLTEHPEVTAIVSGGMGEDEPMTEAQCMYDQLTALGIDPSRIWMEDQATSTWENLHFSLDLIEEKTGTRPTRIGILSSEYHLYRASLFADACGVESVGIPAATSRLSQKINHFMREVAGVWHYLLLGGQYD